MEQYIVSARKYRPSTFASVVGQKSLTDTLKNAISTGRLAHAYLFCGSRGVGKTSCARIFAKTINCTNRTPDGEACNECPSCREFNQNRSFNIIELDAASNNGVDDMRALTEQVLVPPTDARYRVFIVDEVHMLSTAAFNAFLKTLEEPPSHAIFILATTEKHKIIPTILSRCQIFDFNRITVSDIVDHLARVAANEGIDAERSALGVIARKADGAMRDALSIFDQVAACSRGSITYQATIENLNVLDHAYYSRLVDAFAAGDVPAALLTYKEIRDKGFDSQFFINGLAQYLRDIMVAANPATRSLLEADDAVRDQMATVAAKCTTDFIYTALDLLNSADLNYRQAANKQLLVELTLIKLCQPCSPSPAKSAGKGEGHLKPLAPAAQPAATQAAAAAPHPTAKKTAPAPQPQSVAPIITPVASATAARPRTVIRPRLSLNGHNAPAREPEPEPHRDRSEPYTPEAVATALQAFLKAHPDRRVLVATLSGTVPEHIEGDRWCSAVANSAQLDVVMETMPQLLEHMRNALSNDRFTLELRIENAEPSPEFWNRRELLDHMIDDSADLANFIKDFKLNLD